MENEGKPRRIDGERWGVLGLLSMGVWGWGVPGVGVLVGDVLSPGVLSVDVLCVRFSGAFEITFE